MKAPAMRVYQKDLLINDEWWEIQFKKKMPKGVVGLCHSDTRVIEIKLGQTRTETLSTMVHEVLHAMEAEYDIKVPHKAIYGFERAITKFLMDNF